MENCLKAGFDANVARCLIETLTDLGRRTEAEEAFKKWRHRLSLRVSVQLHINILEERKNFDGMLNELRKSAPFFDSHNNHLMYVMLRMGAYEEVKKFGKEILTSINFSPEAGAEIINYELACKRLGSKVKVDRLEKVLQFTSAFSTKAAVYALLDNKKEMIENIKKEMKRDKTFRFLAARWPVFDTVRTMPDFSQAISLSTPTPTNAPLTAENVIKISANV